MEMILDLNCVSMIFGDRSVLVTAGMMTMQ